MMEITHPPIEEERINLEQIQANNNNVINSLNQKSANWVPEERKVSKYDQTSIVLINRDDNLQFLLSIMKGDDSYIVPSFIEESSNNGITEYLYKYIELEDVDIGVVNNLINVITVYESVLKNYPGYYIQYPFHQDKNTKKLVITNIKTKDVTDVLLFILIKAVNRHFEEIESPNINDYIPDTCNSEYKELIKNLHRGDNVQATQIIETLKSIKEEKINTPTQLDQSSIGIINDSGLNVKVLLSVPWKDNRILKSLKIKRDDLNLRKVSIHTNGRTSDVVKIVVITDRWRYYQTEINPGGIYPINQNEKYTHSESKIELAKNICHILNEDFKYLSNIVIKASIVKDWSDLVNMNINSGSGIPITGETIIIENHLTFNLLICFWQAHNQRTINYKQLELKSAYSTKISKNNLKSSIVIWISNSTHHHLYHYNINNLNQPIIKINQSFLNNNCTQIPPIPIKYKFDDEFIKNILNELIFQGEYTNILSLGKGTYGEVNLALRSIKGRFKLVAIKYLEGDDPEILKHNIIGQAYHENIIKTYSYNTDTNSIVMKCYHQGTLDKYIKNNPSHSRIIELMIGVCKGIRYLHRQDIAHRDIKPDNIVIDKYGIPKICDFGTSKLFVEDSNGSRTFCGTPGYMPPEISITNDHQGQEYNGMIADIYSFGVMLLCLLSNPCLKSNNHAYIRFLSSNICCQLIDNRSLGPSSSKCKLCTKCAPVFEAMKSATHHTCTSCTYDEETITIGSIDKYKVRYTQCRPCREYSSCKECENERCVQCESYRDIITKCTEADPKDRISIDKLLEVLEKYLKI